MDDFNAAAGDKKPPKPDLLEGFEKLRRNLGLAAAAKAEDWKLCQKLLDEGAEPEHRGNAALKEMTQHCTMEVVHLLEKISIPGLPMLQGFPLVQAAGEGKRDVVDYILSTRPDAPVNDALFMALRKEQKDIADLLFERLGADRVMENSLIAMLVHRPDLYEKTTAARVFPPDYTLHFINACMLNDPVAMDRALDAMIAHPESVKLNFGFEEEMLMGLGHQEVLINLFQTGHIPTIDKVYSNFPQFFPNPHMTMLLAIAVGGAEDGLLEHMIDLMKPDDKTVSFALSYATQMRRAPTVLKLMEAYPEVAKQHGPRILSALASAGKGGEFFTAIKNGYALPEEEDSRAGLLAASIAAKNTAVAAWLEQNMEITPGIIAKLQAHSDDAVLKRAAELGNDWHFRDDALFWRALEHNDADVLAHFPAGEAVSVNAKYAARTALEAVIARNDMPQLDDALKRCSFDNETSGMIFRELLETPEAAARIPLLRCPLRELAAADMRDIGVEKGGETLVALTQQGFTLSDDALQEGLRRAVAANAAGMAAWLLGHGAELAKEPEKLLSSADRGAETPLIGQLEKWAAREREIPLAGARGLVEASPPERLFAGDNSLAMQAAYADRFSLVMQKASASGQFDPALLCRAADNYGNSILDILGAHGRLNDILVAEVWKDRDAVAFLRDNAPPCYQAQCDFNGLKAAIDQLRLKDRGRSVRIGLKGP
ncbi:MAG: hypothetical protein EPN97_01620 [Alphaproteobacteria bacterium]|nr:MAG: hypothetical protein EPN97_01620 [Alphaproteobacteria bacterium]